MYFRHTPPQPEPEQEQETIMIQPVMIPLVGNSYQTHMPQQAAPMPPQMQQVPNGMQMHPMEALRPPVPMMQQQPQQESHMPPSAVLHHIAQQIIAQRLMDVQREQEEAQNTNELPQNTVRNWIITNISTSCFHQEEANKCIICEHANPKKKKKTNLKLIIYLHRTKNTNGHTCFWNKSSLKEIAKITQLPNENIYTIDSH